MKRTYFLSITLFALIACHSAIKNEEKSKPQDNKAAISQNPDTEIANFPEPNANKNRMVNKPQDLIGYWVGWFEPNESSSKSVVYGEQTWSRSNKINLSIDAIDGKNVTGHSVVAGNQRPFSGIIKFEGNTYSCELKEPGDDKYDGAFSFTINQNDTAIIGKWIAFKQIDISKRDYKLEKQFFHYDPNLGLTNSKFADWEKAIKNKPPKDIDEEPEFYDKSYLSTTEDVLKYNASAQLLSKEQVANLKKADIFILRNSIYARHGFSFKNRPLRAYFDMIDWYIPLYTDIKKDFTDIEKKNIELLLRYEKNAKSYYDVFGRG